MQVIAGKNNSTIIDDCYNASPSSMRAALETLKALPNSSTGGKKIAVIGDMLELGKISDEAHRLIGKYASEIADEIIATENSPNSMVRMKVRMARLDIFLIKKPSLSIF